MISLRLGSHTTTEGIIRRSLPLFLLDELRTAPIWHQLVKGFWILCTDPIELHVSAEFVFFEEI